MTDKVEIVGIRIGFFDLVSFLTKLAIAAVPAGLIFVFLCTVAWMFLVATFVSR
ncbi:MAG: hypothetical protein KC729_00210 [Candidatus Eisenbacteria bacterium]|uniref:Uncharacterized protein n=1 Tax=Eiseniibacteriota bacterium TaxID=2212470 RepID=A0A956RMH8_UNCEI|nr:hypothetical protein [Candidatus Eisenbacteria bacterium]